MSIEIRGYRSGDREQICALFGEVSGREQSIAEWDWKFVRGPRQSWLVWVAEDEEESQIVGQYALIATKILVKGAIVPSALMLDLMVDSRYRGRGLFARLVRTQLAAEECRDTKILIGFPNEQSFPGFVKLGWTHVGNYPLLIRPLDFAETAKKFNEKYGGFWLVQWTLKVIGFVFNLIFRLPKLKHFTNVTPLEKFDLSFDRLFQTAAKRHGFCLVHKDAAYMNWRYIDARHNHYEVFQTSGPLGPSGILVLGYRAERGTIVDLICANESAETTLIEFAMAHFRAQKIAYVLTWCTPGTILHRKFKRRLFLRAKSVAFIVRRARFGDEMVDRLENWHLMPGDNDTY